MAAGRTRILFVTPPGYGNIFPIVPLAWALRTAGCDVLVASGGRTLGAVTGAGLPVVDVTGGADLRPIYQRHKHAYDDSARRAKDEIAPQPGTTSLFLELAGTMVDGVAAVARDWRADVIVHNPDAAAAPIAAAALRLPAVFLGIGLAQTPETARARLYSQMIDACERLRVDAVPPSAAWIDVAPPSVRPADADRWPMRYVPYNGTGVLDTSTLRAPDRPLIAVTLGTVVPLLHGFRPLKAILRAAPEVDADFLVTLDVAPPDETGVHQRGFGQFPPNVGQTHWVPFDALFARCAAVVHHGGAGTTLTALHAGLPQLLLPQGSDHFYNGAMLARRGAGLVTEGPDLDVGLLRQLIAADGLRAAAAEVRAEMMDMPAPNDVAAKVAALAG